MIDKFWTKLRLWPKNVVIQKLHRWFYFISTLEMASNRGNTETFLPEDSAQYGVAQKAISKARNRQLLELFNAGFGIHHAGLLRSDRYTI